MYISCQQLNNFRNLLVIFIDKMIGFNHCEQRAQVCDASEKPLLPLVPDIRSQI